MTLTLRSSNRLTLTVGMPPAAKPITNNLPSIARTRIASSKTGPPTGSTTMSTPRPWVYSRTRSAQPSDNGTTKSAPSAAT
jgi:hypothetical protein